VSQAELNTIDEEQIITTGLHRENPDGWSQDLPSRTQGFTSWSRKTKNGHLKQRVPAQQIGRFTRQLATLLKAGMPLVPALSALVEQLRQGQTGSRIWSLGHKKNELADVIEMIITDINAGSSFSAALSKYPDLFSPVFVNIIAAGEAGGRIDEVLKQLAQMQQKRLELLSKLKSALAYPVMMIVVAVAVVTFLMMFVVPSLTEIFVEFNHSLPWPTKVLMAASDYTGILVLIITVIAVLTAAGFGLWLRESSSKVIWGRIKLKIPFLGRLSLKIEIAKLTRTLASMLASGISVLDALEISKRVVKNRYISNALDDIKRSVSEGDGLASAVRETKLFPPIVFHIIATGQAGARLDDALIDIADMYEKEIETASQTLLSLLEPAILLVMGLVIGFIVMAVLLPVFEINQLF